MTSLSALLISLEHGVRASPSDGVTDAPSSPDEWLDAARDVHWLSPSLELADDSSRGMRTPDVAFSARARRLALASCSDVSVLKATLHGGTLLEQRAALARLSSFAPVNPSEEGAIEPDIVASEPELERDVLSWLAAQSGARAREARATLAEAAALLARTEARLGAAVQGVGTSDPLAELEPHERAALALHLRGASDFVVGCLVDELSEGLTSPDGRAAARLLVGLRSAADVRLVPALAGALLDSADLNVRAEAARVLARIDDARVEPLLKAAYQTASAREERVALIEALGMQGQPVDSHFLREALDYYDAQYRAVEQRTPSDAKAPPSSGSRARGPAALVAALDAIFDVGLSEVALRFASHEHVEVQRAAVRAIGRIGDDTALAWFERMDARIPEGLEAELEAARLAIASRIELRGEKPAQLIDAERSRLRRALERKFSRGLDVTPTKRHRALAWFLMLRAVVVYLFGGLERASKLSYLAHQADPRWYVPSHFQGRLWQRSGDMARAVAGYRRALAAAPRRLFRHGHWITPIVSAFVARAERLLMDGHDVRAGRLLGELWLYDLSRAAPPVRLALHRCRQQLAMSRTVHTERFSPTPERAP